MLIFYFPFRLSKLTSLGRTPFQFLVRECLMNLQELLPVFMFATLLFFLLLGFPVAFTLSGVALIYAGIGHYLDVFYLSDLGFIPSRIFGVMKNFTLLAVPLFIYMGIMLERSGVADELLKTMSKMFRQKSGGLATSVILVGLILAASTGIVGATVVTMGVLTLPTMLERGYSKTIATGTIAASGTLGQIVPPSIVLVLLGDIMQIDVADLFMGAILPGLLLVAAYLLYIFLVGKIRPATMPDHKFASREPLSYRQVFSVLVPPFTLIATVLGSILLGVASPTEAAACGAMGSILLAVSRRRGSLANLFAASQKTVSITSMVFLLLIGAQFFSVVFRGIGGDDYVTELIGDSEVSRGWILLSIMAIIFVLGFFLDFLEISFIVIPIVMPILSGLGYDMLWVAILIAVNLQTSFLTPPFGFALFYLKGVAPKEVTTQDIYLGIIPFVAIQIAVLFAIAGVPAIVSYLPSVLGN